MSESPSIRWHKAIPIRHSRRRYDARKLASDMAGLLQRLCVEFRPFPEARAVFVESPADDVFKGALGSYGKVKGAPSYIAFIGRMDSPFVHERVGYTGEGIILEATLQGLGTCWIGGYFHPEVAARAVSLDKTEKVLAVTPVGYALRATALEEKVLKGLVRSHHRLPLASLVTGLDPDRWPPWVRAALEAARLAPSAVNRQPWRFTVDEHSITVSVGSEKNTGHIDKRLDCGIAMLHIELGALSEGAKGIWEFLPPPAVARYRLI